MRFPVQAILDCEFFERSIVMTGHAGLENLIEHVLIIDNDDYSGFLEDHPFILLSGWKIFNTKEKRRQMMQDFVQARISCLGIWDYEEPFMKGQLEDLIQYGEEFGVPVITLQIEQTYEIINKFFFERVYIDFYRKFLLKEELQRQFYDYQRFGRLEQFTRRLWEVTQKGIYLRLHNREHSHCDYDIQKIIAEKERWIVEPLKKADDYKGQCLNTYRLMLAGKEVRWVGIHHEENGTFTHIIWMFYQEEALPDKELKLFYMGFRAFDFSRRERDFAFLRQNERSIAMLLKVDSHKSRNGDNALMDPYHDTRKRRIFSFSCLINDDDYMEAFKLVNDMVLDLCGKKSELLVGNYQDNQFIMIVDIGPIALARKVAICYRDICSSFYFGEEFPFVGVSSYTKERDLNYGYIETQKANFWARKMWNEVIFYEDLGLLRYFQTEEEFSHAKYLHDIYIGSLIEATSGSPEALLETLSTHVRNMWNRKMTAKSLFVHPNTVRYRLEKIEALLDCSFAQPNTRVDIEVAVTMDELIRKGVRMK